MYEEDDLVDIDLVDPENLRSKFREWGLQETTVLRLLGQFLNQEILQGLLYEEVRELFPKEVDFPEFVLFRQKLSEWRGETEILSVVDLSDDTSEAEKLLSDWNVPSDIIRRLVDSFKVTPKTFKMITLRDLNILFPGPSEFAQRVNFRIKLMKWRGECMDSSLTVRPSMAESNRSDVSCENTEVQNSNTSTSSHTSLKNILIKTDKGRAVLNHFEKSGSLNLDRQKDLVHAISNFLIDSGDKRSVPELSNVYSNEIVKEFPLERKETYYISSHFTSEKKRKQASGKLYDRIINSRTKQRKRCQAKMTPTAPDDPADCQNPRSLSPTPKLTVEEYNEKKRWLHNNCEPWRTVVQIWKETSKKRILEIQDKNSEKNTFSILREWPRYNDSMGFELIEVDFATLHPGKSELLLIKMDDFVEKILKIYNAEIKDKLNRKFLEYVVVSENMSNDERDCAILLLLSPVLIPAKITKKSKPSISDAQDDFVIFVQRTNDIERQLEQLRTNAAQEKSTIQPKLVVIGKMTDSCLKIEEMFVFFNKITYKAASFRKGVDIIIKLCFVFDLAYSRKSTKIWEFLQEYFYEISSESPVASIQNLISKLDDAA